MVYRGRVGGVNDRSPLVRDQGGRRDRLRVGVVAALGRESVPEIRLVVR